METSVHVPTMSLAVVCAAASSLGRITPKISADAVMKGKMRRFMILLLVVGVSSLALAMECALRVEEHITIPFDSLVALTPLLLVPCTQESVSWNKYIPLLLSAVSGTTDLF